MTPETLSAIAAVVLSLLFSYFPFFSAWYEPLSGTAKRLIMLALLLLVSAGAAAIACSPFAGSFPDLSVACDQNGLLALVKNFIAAMIANQTAYAISPKKAAS